MKSSRLTIELNAIEQYFPVVLFIKRYKVFLTLFESVDEILKYDHSKESYWAVFYFVFVNVLISSSLMWIKFV